MPFIEEFDHLKIQLQDIISATENFSTNKLIGRGGFGRVYKGELSLPEGKTMVAFKRLDRRLGQGNVEFWKEIITLSKYRHENLVSLLHFCNEGDEMILVYEHASRGSLDCYLSDVNLTWTQRLKMCVGVARGINFLHDPMGSQQRVIHRDVKSENILLDEKWTAKVSDFGLSKTGPANQPQTYLVSNVVGTPGYCDPLYWEMGFLSKESDVYSFGVVLFEILCGRLCFEYSNGELSNILVPRWRRCYEEERLDEIILVGLKEQMEPGSLNTFSAIAYRCVKKAREERPMIAEIVNELEFALEQQEIFENLAKRVDIAELIKIAGLAVPPLSYESHNQLLMLLLKGFLIDDGNTWVSINMNGEVTKVVSAKKCFFGDSLVTKNASHVAPNRRAKIARCKFPYYVCSVYGNRFRVEVNSRFLSPNVTEEVGPSRAQLDPQDSP
ncbi:putative serine/threonine-protein kinase PBL7 [Bidens hawaiensis]|uniref:putative serine/threonine-protein kinase PBL7 n=1 Tax=Bidens hawaiensis TaxID=980011 RepID=UPI00404A8A53